MLSVRPSLPIILCTGFSESVDDDRAPLCEHHVPGMEVPMEDRVPVPHPFKAVQCGGPSASVTRTLKARQ